jgi:hypothetical protein
LQILVDEDADEGAQGQRHNPDHQQTASIHKIPSKQKKAVILARIKRELPLLPRPADALLNRTSDVGENVVGVRADQPNCAHDDYEDYGQHHRIFGYILSAFLAPQSLATQSKEMIHGSRPS